MARELLFGNPVKPWFYVPPSGGIIDDVEVEMAPAVAGQRNFLTTMQVKNGDAATPTEVLITDGSAGTVLWRGYHPGAAAASKVIDFEPPIRGSVGNALYVRCGTTGAQVYVNAQGFIGN